MLEDSVFLESPRFDLRSCDFRDVRAALKTVGHAVLDGVWNTAYLTRLRDLAERRFRRDDALFAGNLAAHHDGAVETYLGGVIDLYGLGEPAAAMDAEFFSEVERSGLPACYREIIGGDFVVGVSERVFRRVDPAYPLRFAGLHIDGQLAPMSDASPSRQELTLWTPLQACTEDDTPRLLLLDRGETWQELFFADERENNALPIQLKPFQIRDESNAVVRARTINAQFDTLFELRRCYAPRVPFGSAVLFERDIWHSSYTRPGMTVPRFSLDFRAVHDYRVTDKNRAYGGQLFSRRVKGFQHASPMRRFLNRLTA